MKDSGMKNPGSNRPDTDGSQPYSSVVEEHFTHPRQVGTLTGHFETVLSGAAGQREHGTEVVFHIGVNDERIGELAFQAFGCPHTIAACSVLTELLVGRPVDSLDDVRPDELAALIGLPVEKTGRMLVIEDALRKCREAWDNRRLG
jgi:NifU-like protein involved in Fe-S cluster formation